jgi:hypothetical protein
MIHNPIASTILTGIACALALSCIFVWAMILTQVSG